MLRNKGAMVLNAERDVFLYKLSTWGDVLWTTSSWVLGKVGQKHGCAYQRQDADFKVDG